MIRSPFWTPLRLVAQQIELRPIAFASFAFGALQFSFSAVFPTVLARAGWRVADAGLVLATALVISTICRVIWGNVADRLGYRRMLAGMGALMSLGACLAASVSASWPAVAIIALAALFGISAFCWAGIGIAETVRHAPAHQISEATAGTITLTFLGALVGPSLFSSIVSATGSFGLAFMALGGLTAVATVWLVVAGRREVRRAVKIELGRSALFLLAVIDCFLHVFVGQESRSTRSTGTLSISRLVLRQKLVRKRVQRSFLLGSQS